MVQEVEKQRSMPDRLEDIAELLKTSHAIASRMQPPPPADEESKQPTAVGIEAAAARIQQGLDYLNSRLTRIADVVGQL